MPGPKPLISILFLVVTMGVTACTRETPIPDHANGLSRPIEGLTVSNDRWPRGTSFDDLGADIARLSQSATPEGQVIDAFDWVGRLFIADDPAPYEPDPVTGEPVPVTDILKLLNVYGHHWCSGHAGLMTWICRGMGYRARRLDLADGPHGLAEIYYRDQDDIKRFHVFDTYLGWYAYSRDGGYIASAAEIASDTSLLFQPSRKTFPDFYLNKGEREWVSRIIGGEVMTYPETFSEFVTGHDIRWKIRYGERIEFLWGNVGSFYQNKTYSRLVEGGPTEKYLYREIHEEGTEYPQNIPYIRPYQFPVKSANNWFEKGTLCRKYGNGRLIFDPQNLSDMVEGLSSHSKGAHITDRALHLPSGDDAFFTFDVAIPYVITDATVSLKASSCAEDAAVVFTVSVDGGKTWKEFGRESARRLLHGIQISPVRVLSASDLCNPYGRYAYTVRVTMETSKKARDTEFDLFRVETVFQQNMMMLPRLLPGSNLITINGVVLDDAEIDVRYDWIDSSGPQAISHVADILPAEFTIDIPEQPLDGIQCKMLTVAARQVSPKTASLRERGGAFGQ